MKLEIILIEVCHTSLLHLLQEIDDFKEAQTRQAFLNTLTVDVVNTLTALKVRP